MSIAKAIHNHERQTAERRACSREPLKWVVLTYFGQDNWGKVIDLNEGGMRFEFYLPPSNGARLNFTFEAMGLASASFGGDSINESFHAEGDVRWMRDFERTAGVQFANLAEGSREQIRKWLSIKSSADTAPVSGKKKNEEPLSLPTPLEPPPPPSEAMLKIDEGGLALDPEYAVSRRAPATDPSSPLVANILEATTFEAYSRIWEEEEKKPPKSSRSTPQMSRSQGDGAMIALAIIVVIAGLGMILPRFARRNHAVEQTSSQSVASIDPAGAENASASRNPRPFLVEVVDTNNRRWLLWFVNNGSSSETTQAVYKSPLPSSVPATKNDSPQKQPAVTAKPAVPHKFTLIVPEARRPAASSSPANSASLPVPAVRDDLQIPAETPMASILTNHAPPKPLPAPPPIGGRVQPALLLKTVRPVYPPFARSSHTEGDVTVDALIDPNGDVTEVKALSGPPILRQAAMDAIRQWKYDPARLNGQAVSMHLTLTVRFHAE